MMEHMATRDWQLEDFAEATLTEGVEIRLSLDGDTCLIIYPWYFVPREVQPAVERAMSMGFTTITEMGNLYPYPITDVDNDADYILLEH